MSARLIDALRRGAFLHGRRVLGWSGVLLTLELLALGFFVLWTHGAIVALPHALSTDFVSFYAAGTLALAGTPALAYDQAAHFLAEQAATAPGIEYNYFFYPPIYLLLCAPLARLPYLFSFYVFEAAQLGLYAFVAWRVLRPPGVAWLLPILAFPSLVWTLGIGQNALLTASLFGGGLLLLGRRPVLAGVVLGLLCYKPHFGVLLPVALAAGGHWRAFAAAAATVATLALASFGVFGGATWHAYLLAFAGSGSVYATGKVTIGGYVTPFGAALLLGATPALATWMQGAVLAAVAAMVALVWHGRAALPARASVLIAGTLLAVPLALFYDLLPLALCIFWLARQGSAQGFLPWERLLLASLYMAPLVARYVSEGTHLPLGMLASLVVFGLGVAHAWPLVARRRPAVAIA